MNKVYLGETEVANTGSGGAGGGISYDELNASLSAYTYNKAHIDASFAAIPSGGGGGGSFDPTDINSSISDISTRVGTIESNYLDSDDISTFKPIVYTDLSTYENNVSEGTIDQDTMYVITDLADSDELSTLVTVDDLSTYKATILHDVSTTADTTIANANSSINSIKNTAISAVQSQQTTSVNAVNTAKNNANTSIGNAKTSALNDISTLAAEKIAAMTTFLVMSESDYEQITPDASTIYFITD